MPAFDAFQPAAHQPPLPVDRLIAAPRGAGSDEDAVEVDVLFVGGGAAGLAGAIRLAQIAAERDVSDTLQIAVLEKAERPGDHCLSGAVINPAALRELLPDVPVADLPLRGAVKREKFYFLGGRSAFRLPVPPTMHNKGCYVASLCEVVRFLAERAEAMGVHMLAGYPAETLLIEDHCVKGVRTAATGRERDGAPGPSYHPPTEVRAKVTVLCEGARGPLTQAWLAHERVGSDNPQIYALGVKELWRVKKPLREVIHTVGWPIPHDTFGGGWMYPMSEYLISLGLVVGLDSPYADLDPHRMMQRLKSHPLVQRYLAGGELQEWGAKIIPEGGYHALPHRLGGNGVLLAGDAAGLVNVASLKGVHYAMRSGMAAAEAAFAAFEKGDFSWGSLEPYDLAIREGEIGSDLRRTRNMRPAFKHGIIVGSMTAALSWLTKGNVPPGRIAMHPDASVVRTKLQQAVSDSSTPNVFLSKEDANYKSGNLTRDDIPLHVIPTADVPEAVGRMYASLCPAGVYEWTEDGLTINAPNCIDCRATDVLGPRWMPREGGSGPRYVMM